MEGGLLTFGPMRVKDYYKILELAPGATETDIKRSFRKLALRFHPDTNSGNKYSEAWFRELQEAYAVLTDPIKKDAYLQERWLSQTLGHAMHKPTPLTPDTVVQEAKQVANMVNDLDHFRMDHQALAGMLLGVITDDKIDMLHSFNQPSTNRQIATGLLQASAPLQFKWLPPVFTQLKKLCRDDAATLARLQQNMQQRRRAYWWERNQWWVMLASTVALCLLIYFTSRKSN
ncbi:MAG TPA: DnaJ domain-containing protein [Phnomibacter sp.]|nr:DnaJ domain-containing protein [Phnomibacter sp.]